MSCLPTLTSRLLVLLMLPCPPGFVNLEGSKTEGLPGEAVSPSGSTELSRTSRTSSTKEDNFEVTKMQHAVTFVMNGSFCYVLCMSLSNLVQYRNWLLFCLWFGRHILVCLHRPDGGARPPPPPPPPPPKQTTPAVLSNCTTETRACICCI